MDAGSLLPVVGWVRAYSLAWLPRDVFAGVVLTAILVPAGMGYAEASGLPAIVGLYATLVPLLAYAALGPSRILVLGPDSALLPLIAAVVVPLSAGNQDRAVALAALLAFVTGAVIIAAGIARLGFLTDLLSAPVRQGYLNGIALLVLVSQLPRLFGFTTGATSGLFDELRAFATGVANGQTNVVSLAIGIVTLIVILGLRRLRPGFPAILVAVVAATVVSAALDLATRSSIAVVGPLPVGLPPVTLPPLAVADLFAVVPAALGIALVAATDTSVLSRTFAARRRDEFDPDREFIALGGANLATGLLSGMPVSSSASRTPVAEAAGAKTQLTGIVSAVLIGLMLVAAPGLLASLPTSVLAAVVIAAALSLVEVTPMVKLWRVGTTEFWLAMTSFFGVVLIGVIPGVFLAVGVSLLEFIRRAWRPHDAVLGRADGVKGYHDLTYYPDARQIPGLILFRFDAPLFFANADVFRKRIRARIAETAEPVRWVVVAAEPITDVDTTAAAMLDELVDELEADGITLAFAELKDPVRAKIKRYGALAGVPPEHVFPTVGTAVTGYLKATGRSWRDWQADEGATTG